MAGDFFVFLKSNNYIPNVNPVIQRNNRYQIKLRIIWCLNASFCFQALKVKDLGQYSLEHDGKNKKKFNR